MADENYGQMLQQPQQPQQNNNNGLLLAGAGTIGAGAGLGSQLMNSNNN